MEVVLTLLDMLFAIVGIAIFVAILTVIYTGFVIIWEKIRASDKSPSSFWPFKIIRTLLRILVGH
jgi:hypothetical protein